MNTKTKKLRHLTIALQLFAGIGLLTASYLTTDKNWTNALIEAAIQSEQPTSNNSLRSLKAGINC